MTATSEFTLRWYCAVSRPATSRRTAKAKTTIATSMTNRKANNRRTRKLTGDYLPARAGSL